MTRLAEIIPINQEPNRLMGMEWMAPKPDPRLQLMTRPAFVDQYLSDVVSGRIAKQGLTRLANVLNQATSGQPEGLLDYVGPGAMGTPFFRAMTAYHGSPHKFDKFKLSQIGTGEGAQAYGHGLYFAESPGVAKSYRDQLSKGWAAVEKQGVPVDNEYINMAMDSLSGNNMEITNASVKKQLQKMKRGFELRNKDAFTNQNMGRFDNDIAAIDSLLADFMGYRFDQTGALYEVDIPDKYVQNFLDWDKPLSEQPKMVQDAIKSNLTEGFGSWDYVKDVDGGELYMGMAEDIGRPQTSELLNSLGIKGIKYLDQASRGAGEGTRNLVVFDEDIIKILKRE